MRRTLPVLVLLFLAACATGRSSRQGEKLYFALELRHQGQVVGKPKLLGETDKEVLVVRRQPGEAQADYRLVISPRIEGEAYQIQLQVEVPRASGHGHLALLHGEEAKLQLGQQPGDLEVKLLLMKVDSPEFRALMEISEPIAPGAPTSI